MKYHFRNKLQKDATHYAVKSYTDEKKRDAFVDGAQWLADMLFRQLDIHPMEDAATIKSLDKFRLADFKNALHEVYFFKQEQSGDTADEI